MYQFSRSIYRELAPLMLEDARDGPGSACRQAVLEACERVMRRVVLDRNFARPARALFLDVRIHFAVADQLRVRLIIDRHLEVARDYLERLRAALAERARPCSAISRRGNPCQRAAISGRLYCPSHRSLEEMAERGIDPDGARELALA